MQKRWRHVLLIAVALVAALSAYPAAAGVLTRGSYTNILKGRELELPADITAVQGAQLVPEEMLRSLGVAPQTTGDAIRLARGPVTVALTLGSRLAQVDGKRQVLPAAPMVAGDRLFVPAAVLSSLGFSLAVDGNFVLLEDYGAAATELTATAEAIYAAELERHSLTNTIRTDATAFAEVRITLLTRLLLVDQRTALPWGTRAQLLSRLERQTLLMVTVRNSSARSVALDPQKLLMTGENGRQYDYAGTEVPLDGSVTAPVAPGATRVAVLGYDQADGPVTLYYDPSATLLGRVDGP